MKGCILKIDMSNAPNALDMFEQPPQAQRAAMREVSKLYYAAGNADQTFTDMAAKYRDMRNRETKAENFKLESKSDSAEIAES